MKALSSIKQIAVLAGGIACVWLLASPAVAVEGIRKIVHPNGVVEYTNVPKGRAGITVRPAKKNRYEAIYKYRKINGVLTYSDQKPGSGVLYETLKFECFACNPTSKVNWHATRLNYQSYAKLVQAAAKKHGVEAAFIRAIMHAESSFRPDAVSSQGAQGLMQLMPATAKMLGVKNALIPAENIEGGVKYLAQLMALYEGDLTRTAAAYNAGPGAVAKYQGIPPYAETEAYVKRVGILHKRYQKTDG